MNIREWEAHQAGVPRRRRQKEKDASWTAAHHYEAGRCSTPSDPATSWYDGPESRCRWRHGRILPRIVQAINYESKLTGKNENVCRVRSGVSTSSLVLGVILVKRRMSPMSWNMGSLHDTAHAAQIKMKQKHNETCADIQEGVKLSWGGVRNFEAVWGGGSKLCLGISALF